MPDRSFAISTKRDFPYYRKVWKKVILILLAAAFLPLVVIGGGMYVYMARTIQHKTMETLQTEAISHKTRIDSFLSERAMDLKLIAENHRLDNLTAPGSLEQVLFSLQQQLPCFQDLGIIGPTGDHLVYSGPFDLAAKNYGDSAWFKAVMAKGVYISDVFTGMRDEPHFIMAVRRDQENQTWILRATVMAGLFDNIVIQGAGNRKGDAFLVNSKGAFQTTPRNGNKPMTQSLISNPAPFQGVQVLENGTTITLTTWLDTVPWLSVVSMDKQDIFKDSRTLGKVMIFVVLLGGFIMVLAILLTTDSLVAMLEDKKKNTRRLDTRLTRTSFLASAMEMSRGVFGDLNDILSNIHVTARLMKDQADPANLNEIEQMAGQVSSEAIRGRALIDRFARFVESGDPVILDVDIHIVLNQILEFLEAPLTEKNILVTTNFQGGLPCVRSEGAALRQVFLTLLLNSASAAGPNSELSLATSLQGNIVTISISDDGPGLGRADLEHVFDPQHLTRRGDWGFGLAICRSILKKIGGKIAVKNGEEQGVVFKVRISRKFIGGLLDSDLTLLDG